jgi:hypothetical protein
METDSQGRPARFDWQGRRHALARVVQQWQVDTDWWASEGRVRRDYLTVLTLDGLLCVLYYDHLDPVGEGGWFLSRLYD